MKQFAWCVAVLAVALAAEGEGVTVIANDGVTALSMTLNDPTDLWISEADFESATGFALKPEGACLDDICIPIRQDEDSDIFVTREGTGWVNATLLASKLGQSYAVDRETQTWSFGTIPAVKASSLESAIAPDFEMAGRDGETVRLSDFRGKKVILVTWASW